MSRNHALTALQEANSDQSLRINSSKRNWPPTRNYRGYCIEKFYEEEEDDDHENSQCQIFKSFWKEATAPVERSEMYSGEFKEVQFSMVDAQQPCRGIKVRSQFKLSATMQRGAVAPQEVQYQRRKKVNK